MFKGNYVNFFKIQLINLIFYECLNMLLVPTKLSKFFSPIKKDDMF
jgi:hypothetical protein